MLGMVYYFRNSNTGYGYLGERAALTFPSDLNVDLFVATPFDAYHQFKDFVEDESRRKVVLCAVDGTDFPAVWDEYLKKFDGVVVMLDHSNFRERYPFVLGEWFPRLRFWGKEGKWRPREKVAGTIAQLHGRKGFNLLPTVMATLKSWTFELITDPVTASYLKVVENSFPNFKVIINDLSDDELMEWYLSLRVFFSLSMAEGGGLPAYEAAYLGVPTLLPYHTAYKFVPNATFYPCTPANMILNQTGGNVYTPDLYKFMEILSKEELPDEQRPAPPPFECEPDWGIILRPLITGLVARR